MKTTEERIKEILEYQPEGHGKDILRLQLEALVLQAQLEQLESKK